MKTVSSYIVAAVLIGLAVFAVFYWIFDFSVRESWILAVCGVFAGILSEYIRPLFIRKKKQ